MPAFLRSNLIGLIGLVVALSGTAYAVVGGGIDSSKVHLHFGSPSAGEASSSVACPVGQTVVGGGAELAGSSHHTLKLSRPWKHFGNGSSGWMAASNGGGAIAIAIWADQQ